MWQNNNLAQFNDQTTCLSTRNVFLVHSYNSSSEAWTTYTRQEKTLLLIYNGFFQEMQGHTQHQHAHMHAPPRPCEVLTAVSGSIHDSRDRCHCDQICTNCRSSETGNLTCSVVYILRYTPITVYQTSTF